MSVTKTNRNEKGTALNEQEFDDNHAIEISDTGHGLAKGDLVYWDAAAADFKKAIATAEATLCDGIVIYAADANNVTVLLSNHPATKASHGLGSSGDLFLSQATAGRAVVGKPSNGYQQPVGKIWDSNTFLFRRGEWEFV